MPYDIKSSFLFLVESHADVDLSENSVHVSWIFWKIMLFLVQFFSGFYWLVIDKLE